MEAKVSKTGIGELLIYKKDKDGSYINLIIDDEGDIELMHVPKDIDKTRNKLNVSVDDAIDFWNGKLILT